MRDNLTFTFFSFKYAINVPSDEYNSRIKHPGVKKKTNVADAVDVLTYPLGIANPTAPTRVLSLAVGPAWQQ